LWISTREIFADLWYNKTAAFYRHGSASQRLCVIGIRHRRTTRRIGFLKITDGYCRTPPEFEEEKNMKRVKAACIMQTLIFQQKEGCGFSSDYCLERNREEVEAYKKSLERAHTRFVIKEETEMSDGAIIVRVRKEYNATASVGEYFDI